MKRRIAMAFGFAFPFEVVNFFLLMPPLDVGYPTGTSWSIELLGAQWAVFHWIGLRASDLLQGSRYSALGFPIVFACGYLETVVLLMLAFSFRPLIRRLRRKPAIAVE